MVWAREEARAGGTRLALAELHHALRLVDGGGNGAGRDHVADVLLRLRRVRQLRVLGNVLPSEARREGIV